MNKTITHIITVVFICCLIFIHILLISGIYVVWSDIANSDLPWFQIRTSWWAPTILLPVVIWLDKIIFCKK